MVTPVNRENDRVSGAPNLDQPDPPEGSAPCAIIAEIAQAHDGSLGTAHAYIDACASAGATVVKFQTHIASAESTPSEPWRIQFSQQDATRYDYWKRMEFTEEQWHGLKRHADDRRVQFLSSPFSIEAIELLSRIGISAWKIASGELSDRAMLERIIHTRLPVLMSSGMSTLDELDSAVKAFKDAAIPLTVMQCTSLYPCPPEKVGLNLIPMFRQRYQCAVGLSDHSGTIYAGLAAAVVGIEALEVHVTLSRESFGPDVPASITTAELRQLVEGVRFIERAKASPLSKDVSAAEMEGMRARFTKSVVARCALPAGSVLRASDLVAKKPGTGIPAAHIDRVVGRVLKRDVQPDQVLQTGDLV